ncbi:MAG: class I SAM-dependent methyltransferase [Planctomycetota bacterium]|nr:MAG: class I SAM-dependent methyltransferase [Planctomycetota bacterium]
MLTLRAWKVIVIVYAWLCMIDSHKPSIYDNVTRYAEIADTICDDCEWWEQYADCGDEILELGCGYGRVALYLAARGCRVTGIDCSALMLDEARRRDQHSLVQWHCGDFTQAHEWPQKPSSWDGIILPANTIAHIHQLHQLQQVWQIALSRLHPAGSILIDTFAPTPNLCSPGASILLNYTHATDGQVYHLWEQHDYHPDTGIMTMEWQHRLHPDHPVPGQMVALRVWSVAELCESLQAAGCTVRHVAGDYTNKLYAPGDELLLIHAVKQ